MQAERFLAAHPEFTRAPIDPLALGGEPGWVTASGDLRTRPDHMAIDTPGLSGMDGFHAARFRRSAL